MRLPIALLACLYTLLPAASALGDEPSSWPARTTQLTWVPFPTTAPTGGEPTSSDALAASVAVLPLRLSLIGDSFPVAHAFGDDACAGRAQAAGNAVWGFPVQRQTFYALTPRLVVHTFSQLGCPLDAGAGWGVTYALPVAKSWWVVGAMGGYILPSAQPGHALLKTDARLDLVYRPTADRAWAVGVGRKGITLSGVW